MKKSKTLASSVSVLLFCIMLIGMLLFTGCSLGGEDTAAEIKNLNGTIEDLNDTIDTLEGRIDGLNNQISGLNGKVDGLNNVVNDLKGQVSKLENALQNAAVNYSDKDAIIILNNAISSLSNTAEVESAETGNATYAGIENLKLYLADTEFKKVEEEPSVAESMFIRFAKELILADVLDINEDYQKIKTTNSSYISTNAVKLEMKNNALTFYWIQKSSSEVNGTVTDGTLINRVYITFNNDLTIRNIIADENYIIKTDGVDSMFTYNAMYYANNERYRLIIQDNTNPTAEFKESVKFYANLEFALSVQDGTPIDCIDIYNSIQ